MWEGNLIAIHIAPAAAAPMVALEQVAAIEGRGLAGDRYLQGSGTFSAQPKPGRQITLIEAEALEALEREYDCALSPGASRRNLTTRGVPLNHLVGSEFLVGEVKLRGIRLAEPCGHLARLTAPAAQRGLVHRGGLRAEILSGGLLQRGARVVPL